ncbi:MAG: homocysteine S-methyltransferase family protein, partial [Clostridium sp.]|nr:homocysteine S-methyltransferase family protein [Clostridium sp.]
MTKQAFLARATNNILFLDGATGTNLSMAGMPDGVCPEQWIRENPDAIINLQRSYIQAGSHILYAPTFSANRVKLLEYGLYDQMQDLICDLVELTRQAIREEGKRPGEILIAGDITMTGELLAPAGNMQFEELIDLYKEQIRFLKAAGVDLLVAETMMSLAEARAALIAAKEECDLAMMVSLTFEPNGRTLYGTDAKTAAIVLSSLGACAVGANCSTGPAQMRTIVEEMASVSTVPILAKPNAGLPSVDANGQTVYVQSAENFAREMAVLAKAGATILGGCCGTTPRHIQALTSTMTDMAVPSPASTMTYTMASVLTNTSTDRLSDTSINVLADTLLYPMASSISDSSHGTLSGWSTPTDEQRLRCVASQRRSLVFSMDAPTYLIGERINPTGKPSLQKELREHHFGIVKRFAKEQEEGGVSLLDVNVGMSGIDEEETMRLAVSAIDEVSDLPLCLDSSSPKVLETALRHYHGRALVNSVSGETEKIEKLLPIVAKYGAMMILLPLSDAGLPKNLDEKKQIIATVLGKAKEVGFTKYDVLVDGLVTTVGADANAARGVLETIQYCKQEDLATVCGLSNISFGLPNRESVNAAFLTLAVGAGLTAAIANPKQTLTRVLSLATDVLCAKQGAMELFMALPKFEEAKRQTPMVTPNIPASSPSDGNDPNAILYQAVLEGNRVEIENFVANALSAGADPNQLLNQELLPAIEKVGQLFEKGKYFLPQLIASAETMKKAIAVLEPHFAAKQDASAMRPVIVIATVEGDIHDIGKNLVSLMLQNQGFQVIDLGKDVPTKTILDAALKHQA